MKLMELLEQWKKATREYFLDEYICVTNDGEMVKMNGEKYVPNFKDLTRNDWYEYKEYKTNFKFNKYEKCYCIDEKGDILSTMYSNSYNNRGCNYNFNLFPNKELAEFIQKKQLLERKLIVFSYLNGDSKIDWQDNTFKYYIETVSNKGVLKFRNEYATWNQCLDNVFFNKEEVCEKALELYRNEIKEVMEMKIKLGF